MQSALAVVILFTLFPDVLLDSPGESAMAVNGILNSNVGLVVKRPTHARHACFPAKIDLSPLLQFSDDILTAAAPNLAKTLQSAGLKQSFAEDVDFALTEMKLYLERLCMENVVSYPSDRPQRHKRFAGAFAVAASAGLAIWNLHQDKEIAKLKELMEAQSMINSLLKEGLHNISNELRLHSLYATRNDAFLHISLRLSRRMSVFNNVVHYLFHHFHADPTLLSPERLREVVMRSLGEDDLDAYAEYPELINALTSVQPRSCLSEKRTISVDMCVTYVNRENVMPLYEVLHMGEFIHDGAAFAFIKLPEFVAVVDSDAGRKSIAVNDVDICSQRTGNIRVCDPNHFADTCNIFAPRDCAVNVTKVGRYFLSVRKFRDAYAVATNLHTYTVHTSDSSINYDVPMNGIFLLHLSQDSYAGFNLSDKEVVLHGRSDLTLVARSPPPISFDFHLSGLESLLLADRNLSNVVVSFDESVNLWSAKYDELQTASIFNSTTQFSFDFDFRIQTLIIAVVGIIAVVLFIVFCIFNGTYCCSFCRSKK